MKLGFLRCYDVMYDDELDTTTPCYLCRDSCTVFRNQNFDPFIFLPYYFVSTDKYNYVNNKESYDGQGRLWIGVFRRVWGN
jgi:hypothetical protein